MKKIFCLALAAAFSVGMLAACGGNSADTSGNDATQESSNETQSDTNQQQASADTNNDSADTNDSGEKLVIGVASLDLTQEFYMHMIDGSDIAKEEEGVEVIWKSAESNLDKQIALIENFIQQDVDCILIDPYDAEGLIPVCEKAQAAGIPVVSMGNFINSDAVVSNLYNDYQDTKVEGMILANLLGGEGEVALLYGAAGNYVSDERQRGFEEAIGEFPNMKVTSLPVGWDPATTLKVTQDLLASNPNIKGIHCFSDGQTMAVYQAIEQAGKVGEILITSYDGNKDASEAVKNGKYVCTILTGAKRVGYWNVKLGVQLARGETLPQKNYLQSHFIMNDDLKAKVEEWGLVYDGMSFITPDEGIEMFDNVSVGFNLG